MPYMVFPRQIVGDLWCFMMVAVPSVLSLPVYIISLQSKQAPGYPCHLSPTAPFSSMVAAARWKRKMGAVTGKGVL